MKEEWTKLIQKWFEEEKIDSKRPLDEHWKVSIKEGDKVNWIRAMNPRQPYAVVCAVDNKFGTIIVYTGLETALMDSKKRLRVYRDLLLLNNRFMMVKFVLGGNDEEIMIKTDLDFASLNKKEFSDALSVTIISMEAMFKELGLEKQYDDAQFMHVIDIIKEKHEKGESAEKISDYLVKTFKVSEKTADAIVNDVIKIETKQDIDEPDFRYHM